MSKFLVVPMVVLAGLALSFYARDHYQKPKDPFATYTTNTAKVVKSERIGRNEASTLKFEGADGSLYTYVGDIDQITVPQKKLQAGDTARLVFQTQANGVTKLHSILPPAR